MHIKKEIFTNYNYTQYFSYGSTIFCIIGVVKNYSNYEYENNSILPSNVRFCPICGSNSTFYNAKFLKAWDYTEKPIIQNGFMSISDIFDIEIPFN